MDITKLIQATNIITLIMMLFILSVYSLSVYWGVKFLLRVKKAPYCWIKINTTIACFLMVMIYIYLLIRFFTGNPIEISNFSNIVIRPVIFYLGTSIASGSRARYLLLLKKEEGSDADGKNN